MDNRSWIVQRASGGTYDPACLRLDAGPVPSVIEGQVLVRTQLISLDPTNINWLKLDPELQFIPIRAGEPMAGMAIGTVEQSRAAGFATGDVVMGMCRWQLLSAADPMYLQRALPAQQMSYEEQLTVMSHTGRAAIGGMVEIGRAKHSDAVLVSSAAGATGALAAQIAKAIGCYTVGIAGGLSKCRYLIDELGLDAAIDYRSEDLAVAIPRLFPRGIDLFFDNVGGAMLDIVLKNMARGCRIALCGAISQYDLADEASLYGVKRLPLLLFKQARIEGYVASQFGERNAQLDAMLLDLYRSGKLRARTHVLEGFEHIPAGLAMLLRGENQGKLMVRV